MSVGSVTLGRNLYAGNINPKGISKTISYDDIATLVNSSDDQNIEKKYLIGMAGFMEAAYSTDSTKETPLVDVFVDGKTLTIDVNKVDPKAATDIEMFAYCEHMDKQGLLPNNGMGSYASLMSAKYMAINNGFIIDDGSGKLNWIEAVERVQKLLLNCRDMFQYTRLNIIFDVIDGHNEKK